MVWYGMEDRHRVFLFPLGRLSFVFQVLLVFPHLPSFLPSFLPSLPFSLPPPSLPSFRIPYPYLPVPTRTHTHIIAGARPSPSPTNQPAFHHGTRDFVLSWVLSLLLLLLFPREVGGKRVAFHNTSQSPSKHTYLSPSKVSWRLPSQPLWPCVRCTDECPRMYTPP